MRTRDRGYWDWINVEYTSSNDPQPHTPLSWPALSHWEQQVDWTSKMRKLADVYAKPDRSFEINPCWHDKWDYEGGAMPDWQGDFGHTHSTPGVLPPVYGPSLEEISPPVVAAELTNAHLEAYAAFGEQFPQYASAGELVETVKDLKGLLPSLSNSILKSLAGLYVQDKLAWSPLKRDLENLYDLQAKIQQRIDKLKATRGRPVKLRFKREITHEFAPTQSEWTVVRGWGVRYVRTLQHSVYTATATLQQFMTQLDGLSGLLRGFVSAFGLNNPVKTVWEVIPYSFVVDWFFNVSARLDAFTRIQSSDAWLLSNVTWSLKTTYNYRLDRIVRDLIDWSDQDYPNVGRITRTVYRREIGIPTDWWAVSTPQLSAGQFALLGAMKASR